MPHCSIRRRSCFLLCAALLVLLSGCATAKFLAPAWRPGRIAVLPFSNQSADVAIEKIARIVAFQSLQRRGYELVPLEEIDRKLEELGITEGGQLNSITLAEIAAGIPADSYLYGDILEAKRVMLGFYFNKKYCANFKIYTPDPDALRWEDERLAKEQKLVINPGEILKTAAEQFAVELTSDLLYRLLDSHPLIDQIREVTNTSVSTLPRESI